MTDVKLYGFTSDPYIAQRKERDPMFAEALPKISVSLDLAARNLAQTLDFGGQEEIERLIFESAREQLADQIRKAGRDAAARAASEIADQIRSQLVEAGQDEVERHTKELEPKLRQEISDRMSDPSYLAALVEDFLGGRR